MRFGSTLLFSAAVLVLWSCDGKERVKAPQSAAQPPAAAAPHAAASSHVVKVDEVVQAPSYTYLHVTEGDSKYWIATAKQPLEKGMTLYYDRAMEMKDFTSKELDRTFESIWFVSSLRSNTGSLSNAGSVSPYGGEQTQAKSEIHVDKIAGGLSIGELYDGMSDLAGKQVTIRGQVTKFNANIMGRNWVHIQDGTSSGDHYDVTITTSATVKSGDVVVFQGTVALNKDFGAGYKYDLIVEDAALTTAG